MIYNEKLLKSKFCLFLSFTLPQPCNDFGTMHEEYRNECLVILEKFKC